MQLRVLPNGYFSFFISTEFLSKGLRPTSQSIRNNSMLIECKGAVGMLGALGSIDELEVNTLLSSNEEIIKDDFPFPQVLVLDKHILVCNRESIYEIVGNTLELKITTTGGRLWSVASFQDFLYISNGVVAITRDPFTGIYSERSDLPKSSAICNFNGQVIVGNSND